MGEILSSRGKADWEIWEVLDVCIIYSIKYYILFYDYDIILVFWYIL